MVSSSEDFREEDADLLLELVGIEISQNDHLRIRQKSLMITTTTLDETTQNIDNNNKILDFDLWLLGILENTRHWVMACVLGGKYGLMPTHFLEDKDNGNPKDAITKKTSFNQIVQQGGILPPPITNINIAESLGFEDSSNRNKMNGGAGVGGITNKSMNLNTKGATTSDQDVSSNNLLRSKSQDGLRKKKPKTDHRKSSINVTGNRLLNSKTLSTINTSNLPPVKLQQVQQQIKKQNFLLTHGFDEALGRSTPRCLRNESINSIENGGYTILTALDTLPYPKNNHETTKKQRSSSWVATGNDHNIFGYNGNQISGAGGGIGIGIATINKEKRESDPIIRGKFEERKILGNVDYLKKELSISQQSVTLLDSRLENSFAWVRTHCLEKLSHHQYHPTTQQHNYTSTYPGENITHTTISSHRNLQGHGSSTMSIRTIERCRRMSLERMFITFSGLIQTTLGWALKRWVTQCHYLRLQIIAKKFSCAKGVSTIIRVLYNATTRQYLKIWVPWLRFIRKQRFIEKDTAAIEINRVIRGFLGRIKSHKLVLQKAALSIQCVMRRKLARFKVSFLYFI